METEGPICAFNGKKIIVGDAIPEGLIGHWSFVIGHRSLVIAHWSLVRLSPGHCVIIAGGDQGADRGRVSPDPGPDTLHTMVIITH